MFATPAAATNVELLWGPDYARPANGLMGDGYCNEFYPNGPTTYARFIWAVRMLTRNGFVVLIDNHLNSDPTVTQNPAQWLQASSQTHTPSGLSRRHFEPTWQSETALLYELVLAGMSRDGCQRGLSTYTLHEANKVFVHARVPCCVLRC